MVVILFINFIYLSYGFIKYKRDINFVNNVTITLSDEEMTKTKVVDLDHLYNFVVDDFSFNEMSVAAVSDIHAPGDLLMLETALFCTSLNRT